MKKLVIMSDNHGFDEMIDYVYNKEKDADFYIHCGDSETYYPHKLTGWIAVKGNNDWAIDLPKSAIFEVEGMRILVMHGQNFGYFNREYVMNDLCTTNNCQILISGHTHMPMFQVDGDFYYINPGSTTLPRGGSKPSYAVVTIDNKVVKYSLKNI